MEGILYRIIEIHKLHKGKQDGIRKWQHRRGITDSDNGGYLEVAYDHPAADAVVFTASVVMKLLAPHRLMFEIWYLFNTALNIDVIAVKYLSQHK